MPLSDSELILGPSGRLDALERALANRQRNPYERFAIIRGPQDMATLLNLRGKGVPSKEAQRKIDEFLRGRANRAILDLKRWLGLKRGRLPNVYKRQAWEAAALLRKRDPQKYTWRKLARTQNEEEYSKNPQLAMDRMRHGVKTVKKGNGKGRSA